MIAHRQASLRAARAAAAARLGVRRPAGLPRADEGTHELALDLRGDRIDVDALASQKLARVLNVIDAGRLNPDRLEAGRGEFRAIVALIEGAGDAAGPKQHVAANLIGDRSAGDDIGHGEPAARLQHRNASRNTLSLSADRLMTQFEMITSTELSGSGTRSISPLRNSTFSAPAFLWFSRASASMSSVMSSP